MKKIAAVIGAGKLAHSLVPQLIRAGLTVKIILSRTKQHADKLARKYSIENSGNDFKLLDDNIDVVFFAVNDSEIKNTARKISRLKISFNKKLFIHLSGPKTIETLLPIEKKGGVAASLHIMQTFPSYEPVNIKNCYAAIETKNKNANNFLFGLAIKIGLKPFRIKSNEKVYYHLLGVYASNFISANFYIQKLFEKYKLLNISHADKLMVKIAGQTLRNIETKGIENSISGPIIRGDLETIKTHIKFLKRNKILLLHYLTSSMILLEAVKSFENKKDKKSTEIEKYLLKSIDSSL